MKENVSYFAIIPADVRYDKKLRPMEKLMYGEITALANAKGYCFAGNAYFAELYQVSKSSISRWVSSLVENNYIEIIITYKLDNNGKQTKEVDKRLLKIKVSPLSNEEQINTNESFYEDIEDENNYAKNESENTGGVYAKLSIPPTQKCVYPIRKNDEDNNTSINNTSINNNHSYNSLNIKEKIMNECKNDYSSINSFKYHFDGSVKQYLDDIEVDVVFQQFLNTRSKKLSYSEIISSKNLLENYNSFIQIEMIYDAINNQRRTILPPNIEILIE